MPAPSRGVGAVLSGCRTEPGGGLDDKPENALLMKLMRVLFARRHGGRVQREPQLDTAKEPVPPRAQAPTTCAGRAPASNRLTVSSAIDAGTGSPSPAQSKIATTWASAV